MTTATISQSKLLSTSSTKIQHSNGYGTEFYTAIMYLQPHTQSGTNLCAFASDGCAMACLVSAGRMPMQSAFNARANRTNLFLNDRPAFKAQLEAEIAEHVRISERKGLKPAIRLNGTSDIAWELVFPDLFTKFSNVTFYDYTKYPINKRTRIPANYDLTFSRSEANHDEVIKSLEGGRRVAVVFSTKKGQDLPTQYLGRPVVDGDLHDMRFLDDKAVIVGLRAKGNGKNDNSGFVVEITSEIMVDSLIYGAIKQ